MKKYFSIGEFSKLTGVTQRALRYYDEKNLLKPSRVSEAGRRYYEEKDMLPLQLIISLKYLGFTLEDIEPLLNDKKANLQDSLKFQRQLMIQKQEHLNQVIKALDNAIEIIEEGEMDTRVLYFLIHSILNEKKQFDWMRDYFPEQTVNHVMEMYETKGGEVNKEATLLIQKVKDLIHTRKPDDSELQEVIHELVTIVFDLLGNDFDLEELETIPIDDNPSLFASPFTEQEEKSLQKAMEIYYSQRMN
ncbi:MerR family transcriptional regulator [Siminovitchia fordii]|uniref:MerR family transcriptional regulator n=1 Tax=Siminovitchia fordii TaxID=254759 RepID=A0ABQ4K7F7_9BACI|nr:MerR family transcriptional regulator [Siminovitchia fordii]GIN21655.1 MerR family transcriptional regulator [Siminovitchia fordii]